MNKLIVANLKMNMDFKKVKEYALKVNPNIVVCPSYLYLPYFSNLKVGAQDCYHKDSGSFTSYISPLHLREMGVQYVIIGHSERRDVDSDEIVHDKIVAAQRNGLRVILCVGETKDEDKETKLERQLLTALKDVDLSTIIVAYEPIWAIGTGITPTAHDVEEVASFIKKTILTHFHSDIDILYGGSVDVTSIEYLKEIDIIHGFLVGKASIDYEQINAMYDTVNK